MPLAPYNRCELFLEAIRTRDTSALPDPNNREELFLKDIADQVAAIPAGIPISVPAELSELLANLPEPHTHTERFYNDIIGALLVATTVTDTTPYITRVTAGGLPVTGTGELKKKLGNTVCVNQLWGSANGTITMNGITITYDKTTNELTVVVGDSPTGYAQLSIAVPQLIQNRKYLIASDKPLSNGMQFYAGGFQGLRGNNPTVSQFTIESSSTTTAVYIYFYVPQTVTPGTYKYKLQWSDLTLWYGSNDRTPSDLLSHPENWGRYYAGSLAYAAGYLDSADGTVMRSIGRNVWDEVAEAGKISLTTGANVSGNSEIRSKNYIPVIPNTAYSPYIGSAAWMAVEAYDADKNFIKNLGGINSTATFTTPSNCYYIRFYTVDTYGTTYKNDITISLYYPGESGYDQYYPYTVLAEVDTGSEPLYGDGTPEHSDSKTPDGVITRRRARDTIAISDIYVRSTNPNCDFAIATLTNAWGNFNYSIGTKIAYGIGGGWDTVSTVGIFRVYDTPNKKIAISIAKGTTLAQAQALYDGSALEYDLATPTTEQGTDFNPGYAVEAGGTESWLQDQSTGVPQGHETEYKEFTT